MKKFLLRRIGVADDRSSIRPTLQDCMEVVLQQTDVLVDGVLEGLAALALKTKGTGSFGAVSPLSKTVTDLLGSQSISFKKTFVVQLRLGIYNSGSQDFAEQPLVRFDDLHLLDTQQIDASIELAMAQQEVARCVDDVLPGLNALISSLLGWITVQPHLNPLKPEVFVRALLACLVQFAPDEKARVALITPAAGLLGVSLHQLYREVCLWLRSQGIEPALPVGAPLSGSSTNGKAAENSVTRTLVTLDKLRKLLTGELDSGGGGASRQDFLHTLPASYVAMEDLQLVEPMMRRLAQRASQSPPAALKGAASGQPVTRESTQGKPLGKQLGAEVVRMMLENLMQDQRLLPPVRELIGTLEPVLLALAQDDPRFFSERQHPARQFLDRLTSRSLGYKSERDDGFFPFVKLISEAVGVLTGGAGDAAAFAQVLRELETGWSREEEAQRLQYGEAARALQHVEQRNLLAQRLAAEFQEGQKNKKIPELVSNFLSGPWAQVVAQSQLSCTDGSADPDGYLALVDDLLWSVQLRLTRHNRARLVQLVPVLLVKVRQGLQLIQYPEERITVFFDALISLHEKAFEARRVPPVAEVNPPDAPETAISSEVPEFWVADEEARESGYLPEDAEPPLDVGPRPWSSRDLQPGVWVEMVVEGVWLRAQLTWASPHRTLFMFISHGGLAHSMSRRTMERLRMRGSIRFVSDGHVIDNALDAVAQTALLNDVGQGEQTP
ncbi:MAG: DUF1631 family protein [Pseudomonadota bacterium]